MAVGHGGGKAPQAPTAAREHIVVLRALGLGDFLTAVPALRALAVAFPRHRRILAAPSALAPLAGLLGGAVHAVSDADFRTGFGPLEPGLREPDVAVNLHGRGPQSHTTLIETRPRRLLAFCHPEVHPTGPVWDESEHEVDRWCRLLEVSGIPADPARLDLDQPRDDDVTVGVTVIHPGAAAPARRWPPDRWAAVAAAEWRAGRPVLVTGTVAEAAIADEVVARAGLPPTAALAGRTSPWRLAAIVAAAGRVVCGDTGVAHLATAFATPSVVLFGPTSPARWGPPDWGPHRVLWKGRNGDPHASHPDPGLLAISVDDVLGALELLPAGPRQFVGGTAKTARTG